MSSKFSSVSFKNSKAFVEDQIISKKPVSQTSKVQGTEEDKNDRTFELMDLRNASISPQNWMLPCGKKDINVLIPSSADEPVSFSNSANIQI